MLLVCNYIPNSLVSHKSFVLHLPGFCSSSFWLIFFWNKSYPLTHNGMGHIPMHRQKCFSQICLDSPTPGTFWGCVTVTFSQHSHQLRCKIADFLNKCCLCRWSWQVHGWGKKSMSHCGCPGSNRVLSRGGWSCKKRMMGSSWIWDSLCSWRADAHSTEWD